MLVITSIVPELFNPELNAEEIWPRFTKAPIDPALFMPVPPPPMLPPDKLVKETIVAPILFIKPELSPDNTPLLFKLEINPELISPYLPPSPELLIVKEFL